MRAFHCRWRAPERLRAAWTIVDACLSLSLASPGTAPRGVAAAGTSPSPSKRGHLPVYVFLCFERVNGSIGKGSRRKLCSDQSGPVTRISFLKASLKNLLRPSPGSTRSTPRHKARAKAFPSPVESLLSVWLTMITLRRHSPP
jgi:hypothetical protein